MVPLTREVAKTKRTVEELDVGLEEMEEGMALLEKRCEQVLSSLVCLYVYSIGVEWPSCAMHTNMFSSLTVWPAGGR